MPGIEAGADTNKVPALSIELHPHFRNSVRVRYSGNAKSGDNHSKNTVMNVVKYQSLKPILSNYLQYSRPLQFMCLGGPFASNFVSEANEHSLKKC